MAKLELPVQMAIIGAAHGIKGEVRIKPFTGDPAALIDYSPLKAADGRLFHITAIRPQGEVVVARLKGVNDRNAAEALNGTALFVERASLPEDLEEDEFYHADLIGMTARDDEGVVLGTVKAVLNFGGGDILEIVLTGGKDALIPFTKAAVPAVDTKARSVTVNPVAAGLVDDPDDDLDPETGKVRHGSFQAARRPRGPSDAGGNR